MKFEIKRLDVDTTQFFVDGFVFYTVNRSQVGSGGMELAEDLFEAMVEAVGGELYIH